MSPVRSLLLLALALLPAVALLVLHLRAERTASEPAGRVAAAVALGIGAFLAAAGLREVVPSPTDALAYRAFIEAGLGEETLKLLAALLAMPGLARLERLSAGITYAVAAAVGFAGAENIIYVLLHGADAGVGRALTAVPAHVLHGAIVGVALGQVHRAPRGAVRRVGLALLVAAGLHGIYDATLLLGGAARLATGVFLIAEGAAVVALLRRARRLDLAQDVYDLARIPLLQEAETGAGVVRGLAQAATRRAIRQGQALVRAGEPGDALYLVLRGRFGAFVAGKEVGDIDEGGVLGELALLTGEPRNADVLAKTDGLVLRVPRVALLEAVARTDELAEELLEAARKKAPGVTLPTPETLEAEARRAVLQLEAELMLDETVATLARLPLFADAPKAALATLAQEVEEHRTPADRTLVRQGGGGPGLCLLLRGSVEVLRDGERIAELGPGEYFGEIHLLTGAKATATVRSLSDGHLLIVPWPALHRSVGVQPALGLALLDELILRSELLRSEGTVTLHALSTGAAAKKLLVRATHVRSQQEPTASVDDLLDDFETLEHLPSAGVAALAMSVLPPDVQGDYRLAAEGLRASPGAGRWFDRQGLADAIAHSPDLLRFLAAQALRGGRST